MYIEILGWFGMVAVLVSVSFYAFGHTLPGNLCQVAACVIWFMYAAFQFLLPLLVLNILLLVIALVGIIRSDYGEPSTHP